LSEKSHASLLDRLRERKVVQWGVAYVVGAWLLLEIVGFLRDTFSWPAVIVRSLTILLGVGLLIALVEAWFHGEKGRQRVRASEAVIVTALLVLAGAAIALVGGGEVAESISAIEVGTFATGGSVAPKVEITPNSIAVLPFADMSAAGDQEYFGNSLAELIGNKLRRIRSLDVEARTSSFTYRDSQLPVTTIGRQLGVTAVLEGSVGTDGDMIRVQVTLINVENGLALWGETFNERLDGVFAVQDRIAASVTSALEVELGPGEASPTVETLPGAFQDYLRALHHLNRRTADDIRLAEAYLESVLAQDPDYAPARATLAKALVLHLSYIPLDATPELRAASAKEAAAALAIDPTLSDASWAAGLAELAAYRWAEALEILDTALGRDPSHADLYHARATVHLARGRFDEARADWVKAVGLEPVTSVYQFMAGYPDVYCLDGAAALARAELMVELNPDFLGGRMIAGMSYLVLSDFESAVGALDTALGDHMRSYLGYGLAKAGDRDAALALLQQFDGSQGPASYHAAAMVATGLGDLDRALDHLEEAYAIRSAHLSEVAVRPEFTILRAHTRFQALLRRMGLEGVTSPNPTCSS